MGLVHRLRLSSFTIEQTTHPAAQRATKQLNYQTILLENHLLRGLKYPCKQLYSSPKRLRQRATPLCERLHCQLRFSSSIIYSIRTLCRSKSGKTTRQSKQEIQRTIFSLVRTTPASRYAPHPGGCANGYNHHREYVNQLRSLFFCIQANRTFRSSKNCKTVATKTQSTKEHLLPGLESICKQNYSSPKRLRQPTRLL